MRFIKLQDFTGLYYNPEISASELALNAYSRNPNVSQVINRISDVASYLKLKNPNQIIDIETKRKIFINLLLFGEAFIYGLKPIGIDRYSSVEVLVNTDVTIHYNEDSIFKMVTGYSYSTKQFRPEEILHIKYSNPLKPYADGLSPLNSAFDLYRASTSIFEYERFFYENRGIIGFVSGVGDMPLTSSEEQKVQDEFDKKTGGTKKAGRIKVVKNEIKFTPINFKPSEMMADESQLAKLRTICSIYNVPSVLFNDNASSTYNNMQEAMKAFYHNAVLPACDLVFESLNEYLGLTSDEERLEVDYSDIDALQKDKKTEAEAQKTSSEARKIFIETIKTEMELGLITLEEAKQSIKEYDERWKK